MSEGVPVGLRAAESERRLVAVPLPPLREVVPEPEEVRVALADPVPVRVPEPVREAVQGPVTVAVWVTLSTDPVLVTDRVEVIDLVSVSENDLESEKVGLVLDDLLGEPVVVAVSVIPTVPVFP